MGKPVDIEFSLRSFHPGDEDNLVSFLNRCYPGGWGNLEQWEWLYRRNPSFDEENIFIMEKGEQIVGHRGLHPQQLLIHGAAVPAIFMGDTAIHPEYQGRGLYRRLHQATLTAAKRKGACLVLTANSRGSTTYHHNKRTGFIEVIPNRTYLKIINTEPVFRYEISSFLTRRGRIKSRLGELANDLYLRFGSAELSLAELLSEEKPAPPGDRRKVKILLSDDSFPHLVELVSGGKVHKMKALFTLLFSGKVRVKFSSPLALARLIRVVARMVKNA